MAIWYWDEQPKKIVFSRNNMGLDGYLYLPGPSLALVDFDVRIEGTLALAVNTAYPKVKPHYWIGLDKPECFDYRLMFEAFPKILSSSYFKKEFRDRPLRTYPQTYFMDLEKPERGIEDLFSLKADNIYFAWFRHTLGAALHLLLWMGCKRIHFVGCDLGGIRDYYDERVLSKEQHERNRRLYDQQKVFLKRFTELAVTHGVECISCTENSPINEFMEFVELPKAIERSRSVTGKTYAIRSAVDVDHDENVQTAATIQWKPVLRDRGVMIMCDKDQQWLLPWWFENYHTYNHLPVQVVDIGMDEKGVQFCKARGSYTKLPDLAMKNWFKKPFALKLTQFKQTLFLDVDCEIRGSLFDLFEQFKGFCAVKDVHNNFSMSQDTLNSGVILYDWGHPLIEVWAKKVVECCGTYHSDQQCLDVIPKKYTELPPEYNWMRLKGPNDKAVIYHYTGPAGKAEIRKKIQPKS